MNILFYTHGKVYATRGGTERTTVSVASALSRLYGCRCAAAGSPSDTAASISDSLKRKAVLWRSFGGRPGAIDKQM